MAPLAVNKKRYNFFRPQINAAILHPVIGAVLRTTIEQVEQVACSFDNSREGIRLHLSHSATGYKGVYRPRQARWRLPSR